MHKHKLNSIERIDPSNAVSATLMLPYLENCYFVVQHMRFLSHLKSLILINEFIRVIWLQTKGTQNLPLISPSPHTVTSAQANIQLFRIVQTTPGACWILESVTSLDGCVGRTRTKKTTLDPIHDCTTKVMMYHSFLWQRPAEI